MNTCFESYKRFYDEVNEVCMKASVYRYTGLRPPHFIINCESEYEKRHLLRYMTDEYEKNGVLDFSLAADKYLYYELDGSLRQMRNTFSNILSCAVTANHYKYIIGFDVSKLVHRCGESQYGEFFLRITDTLKYATYVFFISSFDGANSERFVSKLHECAADIRDIVIPKLTYSDLASIAVSRMSNEFSVECTASFEPALAEYLNSEGAANINDVFYISERILLMADFSAAPLILDGAVLKKLGYGVM